MPEVAPARAALRAAVALAALAAASPAAPAETLFRVVQDGKWGFVDAAGKLVIPPRFDAAEPFSDGLAPVRLGAKRGYADATGAIVLVPDFEPAGMLHRRFVDGRAVVRAGGRYGYIDKAGKLAIPARFDAAEDFSEGFALACGAAAGCGYVDRTGRGAIGTGFMGGRPVKGGLACATVQMGMGRERVTLVRTDGTRLPGEYDGCGSLSEGLVAVRAQGRWGYLDAAGRGVISPRFEWAGDFSGGLAPVTDESGLCGYVDRAGEPVIAPRFRSCAPFSGGLARVDLARAESDRERWAFVDRAGRVVIDGWEVRPAFDSAADFEAGAAAVGIGGAPSLAGTGTLLGYLDASGRWIWPPTK